MVATGRSTSTRSTLKPSGSGRPGCSCGEAGRGAYTHLTRDPRRYLHPGNCSGYFPVEYCTNRAVSASITYQIFRPTIRVGISAEALGRARRCERNGVRADASAGDQPGQGTYRTLDGRFEIRQAEKAGHWDVFQLLAGGAQRVASAVKGYDRALDRILEEPGIELEQLNARAPKPEKPKAEAKV